MDKLISIIVPIYNAENHIERAITSILNQTYFNLELLLIDDGSTDQSLQVCQKYEKLDSRIKIIKQQNSGVSVARNIGIEVSTGELLIFIDSDDYVEKNMIEILLSYFTTKSDLVVYGTISHNLEKTSDTTLNWGNKDYKELTPSQLASDFWYYYEGGITNSPCNKLYVTSIIKDNNIHFPVGITMGEDIIFNLKYFSEINKIKIIDKYLYHYMLYSSQTTQKMNLKVSNDMFLFLAEIEAFINEYDGFEKSKDNLNNHKYQIYKHLLTALRMPYRANVMTNKKRLEYVIKTIDEFKNKFHNYTDFPQKKLDKFMIHNLKNRKYKRIHIFFTVTESMKCNLKLLKKRI